jgi:hypothetical protein
LAAPAGGPGREAAAHGAADLVTMMRAVTGSHGRPPLFNAAELAGLFIVRMTRQAAAEPAALLGEAA